MQNLDKKKTENKVKRSYHTIDYSDRPTCREKEASSDFLCICPLPKGPRSPPLLADEQSLYLEAKSSKFFIDCLLTVTCGVHFTLECHVYNLI